MNADDRDEPGLDPEAPTQFTPPPPGSPPPSGIPDEAPTEIGLGETSDTEPPSGPPIDLTSGTDALLGQLLGGCRIERKLGQGGMGAAYLAVHQGLDRKVVVKILPPASAASAELRERFLREARATAKLNHPHVVQIYDVGVSRGVYYYVMEFLEGESLHDVVQREGQLDLPTATRLLAHTARGLEAAHDAGIIHRDIKPGNVLVTERGEAKVLDFGLARDAAHEGVSASGQILGTPHYMAPEQASGEADGRSDLYALGITYFRLLSGKLPFDGSSAFNVLHKHLTERPPNLSKLRPDLPSSVGHLVERLLRKDPLDRLQTARETAEAFEAILRELGGGPKATLPPPRRSKLLSALALVAVAALAGGGAWLVARATPPDPDRTADAAPVQPDAPAQSDAPDDPVEPVPTDEPEHPDEPDPVDPPDEPDPPAEPAPPVEPDGPAAPEPPAVTLELDPDGGMVGAPSLSLGGVLRGPEDVLLYVDETPVARGDTPRFDVVFDDLVEGVHTWTVTARWRDEVLAEAEWSAEVDLTPPALELLEGGAQQVAAEDLPATRELPVRVRADDAVAVRVRLVAPNTAPLELGWSGEEWLGEVGLRPGAGLRWVGELPVEIEAEDAAGNLSRTRVTWTLIPRGMVLVGPARHPEGGEVATFFMDRTEVTVGAFAEFLARTGVTAPRLFDAEQPPAHPAGGIPFTDAVRYAHHLGRRLPTAVEWEVAAGRVADRPRLYPWGDDEARDLQVNVRYFEGCERAPEPVGSCADDLSPWGCYDLAGSLQEWVDADAPDGKKVLKGGSYDTYQLRAARITVETPGTPNLGFVFQGFRCARDLTLGHEVDP